MAGTTFLPMMVILCVVLSVGVAVLVYRSNQF